jgi:hypothetical protein
MTVEKKLEARLRKEVKKMGGLALKFVSPGHAGVFDRLVIMPEGKICFVELKSTGQKLSPLQILFRKQMDKLSIAAFVIDTDLKLNWFLGEIQKPEQRIIEGL